MATPAMATREAMQVSEQSDEASWDVYLLFLLRLLHQLYGGQISEIPAGMAPTAAMEVVTDHYISEGSPPASFLMKLQARTTILECDLFISTSAHADEPEYATFRAILQDMYADVD